MISCILLSLFALSFRATAAGSFFPCHDAKSSPHSEVKCASIKLPRSLCSQCPLRETLNDGSFEQCDRIYDTSSSKCIRSLQQYVDENPCDIRRSSALKRLNDGDESVRNELDYFLYSVCEQCCDCIPMGVRTLDYLQLSQRHSASSPTLWSETRGNCPAHARYDVCKIFPSIKSFGSLSNDVAICNQLSDWVRSDAAEEWQTNPKVVISDDIQRFLRDVLVATQCGENSFWRNCQIMEDKQHHLDLPSGSESDSSPPTDFVPHFTPAPIPEASYPVTDSTDSNAETIDSSDEDTYGGSNSNSAEGEAVTSIPSEATNTEASNESMGGALSNSSSDTSSETIAEGDSVFTDGDGSYRPPILQGIRSCFPASSTVRRRDGVILRMEDIEVGDELLVSNGKYSPVYAFSHRSHNVYSEFVKIRTENHSLLLSTEHYLFVNEREKHARLVKKGDCVRGLLGVERVVAVERECEWGLFNPHTIDGQIVVDGLLCSCFTGAVPVTAAQGLLALFRGAFLTFRKCWWLRWLLRDGLQSLLFWNQ